MQGIPDRQRSRPPHTLNRLVPAPFCLQGVRFVLAQAFAQHLEQVRARKLCRSIPSAKRYPGRNRPSFSVSSGYKGRKKVPEVLMAKNIVHVFLDKNVVRVGEQQHIIRRVFRIAPAQQIQRPHDRRQVFCVRANADLPCVCKNSLIRTVRRSCRTKNIPSRSIWWAIYGTSTSTAQKQSLKSRHNLRRPQACRSGRWYSSAKCP